MNTPHYRPSEVVRIGPFPSEPSMAHQIGTVEHVVSPLYGTHRYRVELRDGRRWIFLEPTLRKLFERSDWGMLRGIWQPKREAR